jgi:hypothetical protein
MALAVGGAGVAATLALAGPASAAGFTLSNTSIPPGQESCVAVAASTSVSAAASARSPGLKFKLIAQDGTVVTSTPGPATAWSAFIYAGGAGWHGAGDYTACAKNNGTTAVFLNYLTVNGN